MRLINVHTLELKEFTSNPPPYAILSHRWTDGETSYKEFRKTPHIQTAGAEKVRRFCQFVRENSGDSQIVGWAWVDTACIDARSSAELSEAINSMWNWYKHAAYCVAYLGDVPSTGTGRRAVLESFGKSDWFNRGWTLQELLAPFLLIFTTAAWECFGRKRDKEILEILVNQTRIKREYLMSNKIIHCASAAQRLSWASKRVTTREEDISYCLLGLLNVNMPLLYGEGEAKAFRRLQLELIATSNDESLFAWNADEEIGQALILRGCLANHPREFRNARNITKTPIRDHSYIVRPPYYVTNQGLSFTAQPTQLIPTKPSSRKADDMKPYIIPLNCFDSSLPRPNQCVMTLQEGLHRSFRVIGTGNVDGFRDSRSMWKKGNTYAEKQILVFLER